MVFDEKLRGLSTVGVWASGLSGGIWPPHFLFSLQTDPLYFGGQIAQESLPLVYSQLPS